jgi:predicted Na+-dependent transporter
VNDVLSVLPLDAIGAGALACVFASMTALGIGIEPARVLARGFPVRPLLAALVIALLLVPAGAIVYARLFHLDGGELVGLVLMGISPGAPLALRRSSEAGGDGDFSLVLQVAVAVLAVGAVPLWIYILHLLYGRDAEVSITLLSRQVFLAQILPLSCGILLRRLAPARSRALVRPLLMGSGVLMAVIALALVVLLRRPLLALPLTAVLASAALTTTALVLAAISCGPSPAMRMSAGVICALRNPGIALLIASANGLPPDAKVMVIAHVLLTAILLTVFVALLRRRAAGVARDVA